MFLAKSPADRPQTWAEALAMIRAALANPGGRSVSSQKGQGRVASASSAAPASAPASFWLYTALVAALAFAIAFAIARFW